MYDCNKEIKDEKNQYKPIPVAETVAIIAIKIFINNDIFLLRFKALLLLSPTVLAFLDLIRDSFCGIRCDKNCVGITIIKKKIYGQPAVASVALPVKFEKI